MSELLYMLLGLPRWALALALLLSAVLGGGLILLDPFRLALLGRPHKVKDGVPVGTPCQVCDSQIPLSEQRLRFWVFLYFLPLAPSNVWSHVLVCRKCKKLYCLRPADYVHSKPDSEPKSERVRFPPIGEPAVARVLPVIGLLWRLPVSLVALSIYIAYPLLWAPIVRFLDEESRWAQRLLDSRVVPLLFSSPLYVTVALYLTGITSNPNAWWVQAALLHGIAVVMTMPSHLGRFRGVEPPTGRFCDSCNVVELYENSEEVLVGHRRIAGLETGHEEHWTDLDYYRCPSCGALDLASQYPSENNRHVFRKAFQVRLFMK